jgi:hypothetical protein
VNRSRTGNVNQGGCLFRSSSGTRGSVIEENIHTKGMSTKGGIDEGRDLRRECPRREWATNGMGYECI